MLVLSEESAREARNSPKSVVKSALILIFGITIGAFALGDVVVALAGAISLSGLFIAFMLNWLYIAPRAGEIAKQNLIRTFAEPTEEDSQILQLATINIVGNMGQLAEHEKARKLFKPIFKAGFDTFNESLDMSLKNIKGQVERQAGAFAQDVSADQIFAEGISPFIDNVAESWGASDKLTGMLKGKAYALFKKSRGDNSGSSPGQASGYKPLGE